MQFDEIDFIELCLELDVKWAQCHAERPEDPRQLSLQRRDQRVVRMKRMTRFDEIGRTRRHFFGDAVNVDFAVEKQVLPPCTHGQADTTR